MADGKEALAVKRGGIDCPGWKKGHYPRLPLGEKVIILDKCPEGNSALGKVYISFQVLIT